MFASPFSSGDPPVAHPDREETLVIPRGMKFPG
jgi:hypothetical protein